MTRAELLARVSSAELTEWLAFYSIEPFGSEADYFGHAFNAAHIINAQRAKGRKPVDVEFLMPKFGPKKDEGPGQAIDFAKTLTLALGGKVSKKEP